MAKITQEHIEATYDLGKKVYEEKISLTEAEDLLEGLGMGRVSADHYIRNLRSMLHGTAYGRNMSTTATKYFLENIKRDYGDTIFKKSLDSVRGHIGRGLKYGSKASIQEVINEYAEEFPEGTTVFTLENLHETGIEAKRRYQEEFKWKDTPLSDEFIDLFKTKSAALGPLCEMGRYTGRITNKNGQTIDFSYQMIVMASYFVDYAALAQTYYGLVMEIFSELAKKSNGIIPDNKEGKKQFFACLRASENSWKQKLVENYSASVAEEFEKTIEDKVATAQEKDFILKYICEDKWSHSGKELERLDYPSSGILAVAGVVQADQGLLDDLVLFLVDNPDILEKLEEEVDVLFSGNNAQIKTVSTTAKIGGENKIIYGAPGSGKSYYIDELIEKAAVQPIRTVFHPEYQHSDFVGGVRPTLDDDGDVTYQYIPGPFVRALVEALKRTDEYVYLVVEEINRANAAAVFGDIFQLLDRDMEGRGVYSITTDMALKRYLEEAGIDGMDNFEQIRIPSNLSIYATMNSSDQGVFLLDAAFKRRWNFHYCPLDFDSRQGNSFTDPVVSYAGRVCSWKDFASSLNKCLQDIGVEEDRLIGPYFLSDKERETIETCKAAIEAKVLIYLWDDVLRHNQRNELFADFRVYSDLVGAYRSGQAVFRAERHNIFEKHLVVPAQDGGVLKDVDVDVEVEAEAEAEAAE